MKWTTEKPTKPGWYWWKYSDFKPCMAYVFGKSDNLEVIIAMVKWPVSRTMISEQWAGPIPEPE